MSKVTDKIKSVFFKESENEVLRKSKAFCMMPWVHLHITQYGTVTPCCQASPWDEAHAFGNINKQTVEQIWNGAPMREFRKKMVQDQSDYRCAKCYDFEKTGVLSLRQVVNRLYEHHYDRVKQTGDDGSSENTFPVYWDIRFSNLCNFRCRICGPWSSSRWYDDAKKLGQTTANAALTQAVENPESLFLQLEKNIETVEEIYFAGGEPLLMDEHYRVLNLLEKHKKFNVLLRYNTNFSEVKFKARSVFEIWKKFTNVIVMTSLDDSKSRGELQRKGQKWDDVIALRKEMIKVCPHVHFSLSPTVSVFNIFNLPEFHRAWMEQGLIEPLDIWPTVLELPEEFNITLLPKTMKARARQLYKAHYHWMMSLKTIDEQLKNHVAGAFLKVIEYMESADNSHLIPTFVERNLKLDAIRNESLVETLPELEPLFQYAADVLKQKTT